MRKNSAKIITILIILAFLIISIFYINPDIPIIRSMYRSSQLKAITKIEGNTQRTDYMDAEGKITIAADLGYATKLVTCTEEGELEIYLDNDGKMVARPDGYYGIMREFDEVGNTVRLTYLNLDGKPMIMEQGFAIEEREFNDVGQVIANRYFDTVGNPVYSSYYGYGRRNEYDEDGRVVKITYLDVEGNPGRKREGYSIDVRTYYKSDGPENGKVKTDFYYDEEENPIALSLGQYGVFREYDENGQMAVLTYLDAKGTPMVTTKGYTTVVRTYHADNSVASEQYFDAEGNPVRLSEGQYGQKTEKGQTIYLNTDGSEQFNIKNLMYNQSWFVIFSAIFVVIVSSTVGRKWNVALLMAYLCAVAYMTLMFREKSGAAANLELFWSYKSVFTDSEARSDILKNIWLFIPLGAILYSIQPKKKVLLLPLAISILIEIIQYSAGIGLCELDDIVSNSLGGVIGYVAESLLVFSDWRHRIILMM